jgi:hypothetical protein
MKVSRILLLCSAVALPHMAMADLASTNPAGLGDVHALLDFCTKVDPKDAASFQAEWASIIGGASSKQVSGAEGGGAYQTAYDYLMGVLAKLPKGDVSRICTVSASAWKGNGESSDGDHRHTGGSRAERPHETHDD